MRSVVKAYRRDGFLDKQDVRLVASYVDGNVVTRRPVLFKALGVFLCLLTTTKVDGSSSYSRTPLHPDSNRTGWQTNDCREVPEYRLR